MAVCKQCPQDFASSDQLSSRILRRNTAIGKIAVRKTKPCGRSGVKEIPTAVNTVWCASYMFLHETQKYYVRQYGKVVQKDALVIWKLENDFGCH
jgi:hypothetical protein